jgi:hypothetical protein
MNSILTSIKKLLGITAEYDHFDPDIIMHINSALMALNQLGVGPSDGFSIEDDTATWQDFIGDVKNIEAVKTYVYLKVRIVFDPPTSGVVTDSMKEQIRELEWRLNAEVERG